MSVRFTGQSEQVTIRVPRDLIAALRAIAKAQQRTYTALLIEGARKQWRVPEPAEPRLVVPRRLSRPG